MVDYIAAAAGTWNDFKTRTRDGRVLDTAWINVLLSDSSNIGIGIDITDFKRTEERVRRFSRELLAAREDGKKRVSAALHHDVGSLAVGLSAYFDAMEDDIRFGKTGEAIKSAKTARELFEGTVARLKGMAVELRPPDLDIIGLRAAMRQHF